MKVKSLSHVGITVSDFKKSVQWYEKYFGFGLISESAFTEKTVKSLKDLYQTEHGTLKLGFLRMPKGGVVEVFEFSHQGEKVPLNWNRPGVTHFTLDVKNVKGWYEKYKNDINFMSAPQSTDGNDWVFLKDPDGNLIELIDLKFNYFLIRRLGAIAGYFMKKTQFKHYYEG